MQMLSLAMAVRPANLSAAGASSGRFQLPRVKPPILDDLVK